MVSAHPLGSEYLEKGSTSGTFACDVQGYLSPPTRKLSSHWLVEKWSSVCIGLSFLSGSGVKNLPAKAGDTGDAGSISGSGRSPREGMATHSSILAWRIPWTEDPGGLQSMGLQRAGHDWATDTLTFKGLESVFEFLKIKDSKKHLKKAWGLINDISDKNWDGSSPADLG